MPRRKKKNPIVTQVGLFGDSNTISPEALKAAQPARRGKPEKKLMNDIMKIARRTYALPCIHLEYYCGNHFNLSCPKCGHVQLATCHNTINRHLAGHYDIIGIAWAIETKHKVNKGPQDAKPSPRQHDRALTYDLHHIPHIAVNESHTQQLIDFLSTRSKEKYHGLQ